jgi:hypothetical protein
LTIGAEPVGVGSSLDDHPEIKQQLEEKRKLAEQKEEGPEPEPEPSAEGAGKGGKDKKGAQDKRLTAGEIDKLKDAGIDIHELKSETLGTQKNLSNFDLFKTKDGDIVVKPKNGKGEGTATGLNIKKLD